MSTRVSVDQAEAAGFEALRVDLDHVTPGQTVQVTWKFRNSGRTTWNGQYKFAYTIAPHAETANNQRSPLGSPTSLSFNQIANDKSVKPGELVTLKMRFVAPNKAGTYATNWQLQTPNGQRFGPVRWMRLVIPKGTGATLDYQVLSFTNSVQNFNNMMPGHQFTAVWSIKNTGTATWNGDYQIAYLDKSVPDTQTRTRTMMGATAVNSLRALSGRESVRPGETVNITMRLNAPTTPGAYAFHWQLRTNQGAAVGGVRWLILGIGSQEQVIDPIKPPSTDEVEFGMNVNINDGHPMDAERMNGLGWVRFVYWASRERNTPEQAYQKRYRKVIQTYADQGIKSLIILHQDTYWGNAPWDNGDWDTYARHFGEACARVARACSEFGDMVAFQIYNETDSGYGNDAGNPNHSAIGITPANYAKILRHASAAIRQATPNIPIIFGGLKTGPGNAINYTKEVRQALNGKLPVDALAYHPYGRYVNFKLFNFGSIGTLGDALDMFKKAFPKFPLWISEVGVAADVHIGSEHYANIATYIREVVDEISVGYSDYVQALIWFGWTDIMRNAGVNTRDNKPKPHVFDAFEAMRNLGKGGAKSLDPFAHVSNAQYVSFSSTHNKLNAVEAGTELTCRWTFKNSGTTVWNDQFKLKYVKAGDNPDAMMTQKSFKLTEVGGFNEVKPGETAVFTLNFTAPKQSGRTYRSTWDIVDHAGSSFAHFYVEVVVIPASPVGTSARRPDMQFIQDVTVMHGEQVVAGTNFDKQWRVKNTGSRHWSDGFRLVYVDGDLEMGRGKSSHIVPDAKPNDVVTLSVPMTAPQGKNGELRSAWRMQDDRGNFFGTPLQAVINVGSSGTDSPVANTPLARLMADTSMWYSQRDPRWLKDQLGFGSSTIETWGCLMTCMAMALTANGIRLNPQELNQRLKNTPPASGGFKPNSSVTQFAVPWYIGRLYNGKNVKSWPNKHVDWAVWTGENPITRIDNALARGHIVVAQVDSWLNTAVIDQHWVVIVKRVEDDYLMLDPLTLPSANNRVTSLKAKYMNHIPSISIEDNLRNAIISAMVFSKGGSGS
ncbi:MAG: NBR1-Ig-like domain-containing protein [Chloroflexota bacterium]